MASKPKAPPSVIIVLMSTITIVLWIGLEIYRSVRVTPDPEIPSEVLEPLNPNLDESALSLLPRRIKLSESEAGQVMLVQEEQITTPGEEEAATEQPEATQSSQPEQ